MHAHIDFETRSTVELPATGAHVYASHPTTSVWCLAYAFGDDDVRLWRRDDPDPEDLLEHVRGGGLVYGHNCAFEYLIWNNVMTLEFGWPTLPIEQLYCTMAMAYAMGLPGSLENAAAAAGINQQKDQTGKRIMLQLSRPKEIAPDGTPVWYTPESESEKFEKLYAYCKQDVEVERALAKRLLPLSPKEREIWLLDFEINNRGIQVDLPAVRSALRLAELEADRLNKEIKRITGNVVAVTSENARLTKWLQSKGVDAEGVAKGDVTEMLGKEIPPECREALLIRQEAAKTSTKKLVPMLASAGADGRLRGLFQYHGAGTGRWAGRRIQPQNFPRPSLSDEEIDDVFQVLDSIV